MSANNCLRCSHWMADFSDDPVQTGVCKRYPPIAGQDDTPARRPITASWDWCGEWQNANRERAHS